MTSFAAIDANVWACSGEKKFIVLNARWRVRLADPIQWILECRRGRPGKKDTGWRGCSYCTQRTTLLRDISEKCGEVDSAGLRQVKSLPERFPYRSARKVHD